MKHTLTALITLICITAYGQVEIKEVDKSLAKISDKLYASKYEVSNNQYITFIHALKKGKQLDQLAVAQIDSSKWLDKLAYNKPFVSYYHAHPAYKDYPVVNISHDAAVLFCEWLTNEYNSNPDRKFKRVTFRLPTEQEWSEAAQGGDSSATYPWKGVELKDKKGVSLCNYAGTINSITNKDSHTKAVRITASVKSYTPNNFGLYNMSGNAAEMLSDKNIVKGGSWLDTGDCMMIKSKQSYDGSTKPSVGFRYFVDIIEI